jgi:hypothetical protein
LDLKDGQSVGGKCDWMVGQLYSVQYVIIPVNIMSNYVVYYSFKNVVSRAIFASAYWFLGTRRQQQIPAVPSALEYSGYCNVTNSHSPQGCVLARTYL